MDISEEQQLSSLSKNEKRFLSRRYCMLCDITLDKSGCWAIWERETCSEQVRIKRRIDCLKTYKPRIHKKT